MTFWVPLQIWPNEIKYRSGTINFKSFVGMDFLWIKWKLELSYALSLEFYLKCWIRNDFGLKLQIRNYFDLFLWIVASFNLTLSNRLRSTLNLRMKKPLQLPLMYGYTKDTVASFYGCIVLYSVQNLWHLRHEKYICLTSLTRAKCGVRATLCWKIPNISGSIQLFAL